MVCRVVFLGSICVWCETEILLQRVGLVHVDCCMHQYAAYARKAGGHGAAVTHAHANQALLSLRHAATEPAHALLIV